MIETDRLLLRRWRASDLEPFAALNADPAVMEHLPAPLDHAGTAALIRRIEGHFDLHGFGLWAVEVKRDASLAGYVGLAVVDFEAPFAPAVEVGWRLARSAWGHGYATEAARAALDFGFEAERMDEIVSFTVPANLKSQAVMARIGLVRDAGGDFDHPRLPAGHRLRRHVLYRIDHARWLDAPRARSGSALRPVEPVPGRRSSR
jgi:RimJ/RimL family protein N-acetyltransferase